MLCIYMVMMMANNTRRYILWGMFFFANAGAMAFFALVWYYVAMYGGIYIYEQNFWIRWTELAFLMIMFTLNILIGLAPKE